MINPETIASQAKAMIAANPKFAGITPELDAIVSAISLAVATGANIELAAIKTQYNLHVHGSAVGPTTPPVIPMA